MTQIPVVHARGDVPRECGGSRDIAGVYFETGLSPWGKPLECFVFDPIPKFNPEKWGLGPRQPIVVEIAEGIWHILDWVGENNYPNPCDPLEEIRKWGLSRKGELSQEQYAKLDPVESRIILVSPRAWIDPELLGQAGNDFLPLSQVGYQWDRCPQKLHPKATNQVTCSGWLWHRCDEKVEDHPLTEKLAKGKYVIRQMAAFQYNAAASWNCFLDASPDLFAPGLIAAFPITRIAVVRDKEGNAHEDKLKKLEGCKLRVDVTEC